MSLNKSKELRIVALELCRKMRKNPTPAEYIVWKAVRKRKFKGIKFYRQYPLFFDYLGKETFYIADFYSHEKKIVVEIDGRIHNYTKERDKLRTEVINMLGINVIRFKNEEVINNLKSVLERLAERLNLPLINE